MAQEAGSGDDDLVFGTGEDTGELGMAEESVLRSIPAHRLRALEKQQTDAALSNNATRARDPPGLPGGLCAYQQDCISRCEQHMTPFMPSRQLRLLRSTMQMCHNKGFLGV